MLLEKPEAILFDLDGTLFQSETLFLPAYYRTFDQLRQEGLYQKETPPEDKILGSLGLLLEEIWRRVLPEEPVAVHQRANKLLLQYQMEELEKGTGTLYPGVEQSIHTLHQKGYKLFVASNGMEAYVKNVIFYKGLQPYFTDLYSAGEYQTWSKNDLVRMLLQRYSIHSAWMVGDRSSDVEAGKANGLLVIGCDYSDFGNASELDGADIRIKRFEELLSILS
jgi:phosphoglycolate phosphatase